MPRPAGQSCNSCFFWVQTPLLEMEQGLCCRYPPGHMGFVGRGQATFSTTAFPITLEGDWCGEYREGAAQGTSPDDTAITKAAENLKAQTERLEQAISKVSHP